eukprot:TRINITY_DN346_c0_g2_i1.p1 TRINITY_DN346_c0_g2~~TRINITY_DN346_c0_g2_i1.p1  ORF type:complete len:224 (+),score=31.73 TRINITY_DN346_c0_g2_i1:40-672(+)
MKKVQVILDHQVMHPMPLSGSEMYYKKRSQLPPGRLDSILEGIDTIDLGDSHLSRVASSMLYLCCNGLDEAHDIVTPYSWPHQTDYSGPPIPRSPAKSESQYVHAMIHRREGDCEGEFGNGFNNSKYWFSTLGSHHLFDQMPRVIETAITESQCDQFQLKNGTYKPSQFVDFCEDALGRKDVDAIRFCELVINREWRLLFDHCYQESQTS